MKTTDSPENYEQLKQNYLKLEQRLEAVNLKLSKSEQLKSDFLSNIKNEINNPLTSILGLLNQISRNPEKKEQTSRNASLIYNEVYALNFQMKNIFNAAEIEAGQSFPELSNLNVKHLIEDLVGSFEPLATKKSIKIIASYEAEDTFVSDREKLEIILSNLIANAIKFSPSKSEVQIAISNTPQGGVSITIKDDGVGIESNDLDDIYDRFKQLDTGTRKEFGGHGLGLSIVHSLVDILDGTLKLESAKGKGTSFKIELPMNLSQGNEQAEDEVFFDNDLDEEVF